MIKKIIKNLFLFIIFLNIGFIGSLQYAQSINNIENSNIINVNDILENNLEYIKFDNIINQVIIFEDDMELNEINWNHTDLTKIEEGHWIKKDSGYDSYFWCGINNTITRYDNNWNDVALINMTFDFSLISNISLILNSYHKMDENDYGFVEISSDGGRHWDIISNFTGIQSWKFYHYNLSFLKQNENIKIRFRFLSNESQTNEGWLIDDIHIKGDNVTFFYDDFETQNNNWIIEKIRPGDWWQRINITKNNNDNNLAWWCGDEFTNSYPPNLDNELLLKNIIDFSKIFDIDVFLSTSYNISNNDKGFFEIKSIDESNWYIIDTFQGKTIINNEIGWINKSYELDQWIGKKIIIRFRFISDSFNESKGFFIDDFKIMGIIDNDPPETTCILTGDLGQNEWYISQVELSLNSNDGDGYGVDTTYYKLNNEDKKTYNTPLIVNENGWHTIEYWSVDKLGNIENHKYKEFKIDMDIPNASIIQPEIGFYLRGNKIFPLFRDDVFFISKPIIIKDIEIRVDASDFTSGINRIEFYLDDELISNDYTIPYSWLWSADFDFKIRYEISIIAIDEAGNNIMGDISVWRIF